MTDKETEAMQVSKERTQDAELFKAFLPKRLLNPVMVILFTLQVPWYEGYAWFLIAHFMIFAYLLSILVLEIHLLMDVVGTRREAETCLFVLLMHTFAAITAFASAYVWLGLSRNGVDVVVPFIEALYFSAATWTTLGYSELQPSVKAYPVAVLEAYVGYLYMALLVGLIANTLRPRFESAPTARIEGQ